MSNYDVTDIANRRAICPLSFEQHPQRKNHHRPKICMILMQNLTVVVFCRKIWISQWDPDYPPVLHAGIWARNEWLVKYINSAMVSEGGLPHPSKRGSGWAQHQQLSLDCHSGYHHRHHHFGKRKNLGAVVVPLVMQCLLITITITVTTTTCTNLGSTECSRRS